MFKNINRPFVEWVYLMLSSVFFSIIAFVIPRKIFVVLFLITILIFHFVVMGNYSLSVVSVLFLILYFLMFNHFSLFLRIILFLLLICIFGISFLWFKEFPDTSVSIFFSILFILLIFKIVSFYLPIFTEVWFFAAFMVIVLLAVTFGYFYFERSHNKIDLYFEIKVFSFLFFIFSTIYFATLFVNQYSYVSFNLMILNFFVFLISFVFWILPFLYLLPTWFRKAHTIISFLIYIIYFLLLLYSLETILLLIFTVLVWLVLFYRSWKDKFYRFYYIDEKYYFMLVPLFSAFVVIYYGFGLVALVLLAIFIVMGLYNYIASFFAELRREKLSEGEIAEGILEIIRKGRFEKGKGERKSNEKKEPKSTKPKPAAKKGKKKGKK